MTTETELPAEQPVEIDLSKEDKVEIVEKVEKVEKEPELEVPDQDDGAAALQQHLQQAQAALDAERRRSAEEYRLRVEAQRQAYANSQGRAQAEYDAILNGIGQAEAEKQSARSDLKAAMEAQDADALADAQERLATATAYLTQLHDGKAAHEMRAQQYQQQLAAQQQAQQVQRQQAPRRLTVSEQIDAMPNLIAEERAWLKNHPDVITSNAKTDKVKAAFWETQEKGIERGSKEYFAYMEKKLGYARPKTPILGAPPSREPASLGGEVISGSRVTLTSAQRDIARSLGMSDVDYAKNLLQVRQAQKAGLIQ